MSLLNLAVSNNDPIDARFTFIQNNMITGDFFLTGTGINSADLVRNYFGIENTSAILVTLDNSSSVAFSTYQINGTASPSFITSQPIAGFYSEILNLSQSRFGLRESASGDIHIYDISGILLNIIPGDPSFTTYSGKFVVEVGGTSYYIFSQWDNANNLRILLIDEDNNIIGTPININSISGLTDPILSESVSVDVVEGNTIVSFTYAENVEDGVDIFPSTDIFQTNVSFTSGIPTGLSPNNFSGLSSITSNNDTGFISSATGTVGGDQGILFANSINSNDESSSSFLTVSLACLAIGTKILTPSGYVLIENLSIGDKLITGDKRITKVTKIVKSKVFRENLRAFTIKKGTFNAIEDTILTEWHSILDNKQLIPVKYIKSLQNNKLKVREPYIIFYNLGLTNKRLDTIIANGIIVEGYGDRELAANRHTRNKDPEFIQQFE